MSKRKEWGVFRKGTALDQLPMENFTFPAQERAEKYVSQFINGASWLEVRSREVTEWSPAEVEQDHLRTIPTYANCATCDGGGCGDCK